LPSKLEILAKNFAALSPDEMAWEDLMDLRVRYRDYLGKRSPDFILNLFLMIMSLKKTGNFDFYESIRNDVFIVGFYLESGHYHEETCPDCDGDGYTKCSSCDGSGNEPCPQCEGEGTERCFECEGKGEIDGGTCPECNGEGEIDCGECGGDSEVRCSDCDGNGNISCNDCDGNGEIESDSSTDYETHIYLSWNKNLRDLAEIREGTEKPLSDDEYNRITNADSIMIGGFTGDGEKKDFVESDKYYVYFFDDDSFDLAFKGVAKDYLVSYKGLEEYMETYE
jgi:hypothetical protein